MPLARLTTIDGLDCELDAALGLLPDGRYSGVIDGLLGGDAEVHAAVDRAGRLWATGHVTPVAAYAGPRAMVAAGTPATAAHTMTVRLHGNYGLSVSRIEFLMGEDTVRFSAQPDGDLAAAGVVLSPYPIGFAFEQRGDLPPVARAFDPASLAGRTYVFLGRSQFSWHERSVSFADDGSFCVESATACDLHGQVGAVEPGLAMFAFTAAGRGAEWSGKAWLEVGADGVERLVLVGTTDTPHSAGLGVGLVGERQSGQ